MLTYRGLSQSQAEHYKSGGDDAYQSPPERQTSNGTGTPCRHCLRNVPDGQDMLVLAHRPFADLHPYAETGPIFLCADVCRPDENDLPPVLRTSPDYLLKGYGADERIVYGTGAVVASDDIPGYAASLLERPDIAFVDVRSARNNCWLVRITNG